MATLETGAAYVEGGGEMIDPCSLILGMLIGTVATVLLLSLTGDL